MLNKAAKLTLIATSLAPVCLTLWFVEFSKAWNWQAGLKYLLVAALLSLLCAFLVRLSGKNLEKLPVKIKAVKTVDKEIVGFLLVYLLPLINQTNNTISLPVLVFISQTSMPSQKMNCLSLKIKPHLKKTRIVS